MITIERTVDISKPIQTETLRGNEFKLEANAHTFRISVANNGAAVALTGSVSASMLLADGSGLTLGGSLDNGVAVLTLPQAAYGVPGRFMLAIYSVQTGATEAETVKTCIYACVGAVINTYGDQQYDPGNLIPDAETLAAYIEACQNATTAANTAAGRAETAALTAVTYAEQTGKTDAEKTQARTNIGAASDEDVSSLKSAFASTMEVMNTDGSLDLFRSKETLFYDGYYNGTPAYTGTGTQGKTNGWGVVILHVQKGENIVISGMPNSGGVASVWLLSNNPSDVAMKAWNSNRNNGEHYCLTDWLAVADFKINYEGVTVQYGLTDATNQSIKLIEEKTDKIVSAGYQFANRSTSQNGKRYADGSITIVNDSTNPYVLYAPFKVKAGRYYFQNLFYPYSNYINENGVISTFQSQNGYIDFTGETLLYLTGYASYGDLMFADSALPAEYVYGFYNAKIKGGTISIDKTLTETNKLVDGATIHETFGTGGYQYLNENAFIPGYYYNPNRKTKTASSGYVTVEVRNIPAGTYYFRNVLSDFTNIENAETLAIASLASMKTSGRISGDVTINYTYNLYLSFHSDYDNLYYGKTVWCNSPYYPMKSDRVFGVFNIRADSRKYSEEIHPVFTVEKDGTGDFLTVKEALETAVNYPGAIVKIGAGTFNLIDEFGSDYFENLGSVQNAGLRLYNDITVEGTSHTVIVCNYTGSNNNVMLNFSPFNIIKNRGVYGGMTLKNLKIECSNVRYAVHDEAVGSDIPYTNQYIACNMKIDNSGNTAFTGRSCIGGGLGAYGTIIVQDSVFESVPRSTGGTGIVSYHNGDNANASNKIIIKNNYFKGNDTARVSWSGQSTYMSTAYISGNSFGSNPYCESEGGSTNVNMEMVAWNNEIRA